MGVKREVVRAPAPPPLSLPYLAGAAKRVGVQRHIRGQIHQPSQRGGRRRLGVEYEGKVDDTLFPEPLLVVPESLCVFDGVEIGRVRAEHQHRRASLGRELATKVNWLLGCHVGHLDAVESADVGSQGSGLRCRYLSGRG